MKFRDNIICRVCTIATGFIFLNMSFFMTEISALKLQKDSELLQNIVKLISVSGLEEEKDASGESSESSKSLKGIEFYLSNGTNPEASTSNRKSRKFDTYITAALSAGNFETAIQPPEA